jgi:hypothetical protein
MGWGGCWVFLLLVSTFLDGTRIGRSMQPRSLVLS